MKKIFVLPILAILLVSCGSPTPAPIAQTRPALTDPSAPIEAQAGNSFHIVIDANSSTGYHWELIGALDGNVVEFVSRDYTADEPVAPGSGGVDVWVFKAVSAGEAQITLGSYPPGVTEGEPEQSVTFNVVIK